MNESRRMRKLAGLITEEQFNLFDIETIDPKKIKKISKKLYDMVKKVDEMESATYSIDDNKEYKQAKDAIRKELIKVGKLADKELKGEWLMWNDHGNMIPVKAKSIEYSLNGGDWWVYFDFKDGKRDDQAPIIDFY